jgi:hypothetical protein
LSTDILSTDILSTDILSIDILSTNILSTDILSTDGRTDGQTCRFQNLDFFHNFFLRYVR